MGLRKGVLFLVFLMAFGAGWGCGEGETANGSNENSWNLDGDGDEVPGDGDEVPGDGDEVPGDGDEVPGDGDEVPGDGDEEDHCEDGVRSGDETDVDCGGSCGPCEEGLSCVLDGDCVSDHCHQGICQAPRLELGESCERDRECLSDRCEMLSTGRYCTESCADCVGPAYACFEDNCLPASFCEASSGYGFGPGCVGEPCDQCDDLASCVGDGLEVSCECPQGYEGDGLSCTDIDECADPSLNECASIATCTNLAGSYECSCPSGYEGDGTECVDINECQQGTNSCSPNGICFNFPGSYGCACAPGFQGDGYICTDIDECAQNLDNCHEFATCENTVGSFTCECLEGFSGNGVSCEDIDECALGLDQCSSNASCLNTPGSYECECLPGFLGDGVSCARQGDTCEVAVEIDVLPYLVSDNVFGLTNQYAVDQNWCPGLEMFGAGATAPERVYSFTPDERGYYFIEVDADFDAAIYSVTDCSDLENSCVGGIDENFSTGVEAGSLFFEEGTTYFVMVGPWAASPFSFGTSFELFFDWDQCLNDEHSCSADEECFMTPEGYECGCADGFELVNGVCIDIDECALGLDDCHPNATCSNNDGGFECLCEAPYEGDGVFDCAALAGNNCSDPFPIGNVPFTYQGDTTVRTNDFSFGPNVCPGVSTERGLASNDEVFSFTPALTGLYSIVVEDDFDSVLYVTTNCEEINSSTCIGASDSTLTIGIEELEIQLQAGQTYYIVVDGWGSTQNFAGIYTITVELTQ